MNSSQEAIFRFLGDPATHGGAKVRRLDTHAASVFLAGEHVYKVKRAVRFPFLDYSTLERRKAACEAEIEVNRPFAPAIYLGVVAISRGAEGTLKIGGDGEPVEWAVKMRRFDENQTLDHLADSPGIDRDLADALGRKIADGHAKAPKIEADKWIKAVGDFLDQNEEAFREFAKLFPPPEAETLTQKSRAALQRITPLIRARGERGLIRRGHGDLHLGNIALIDGAPVLFDAIEFDELIAAGDVLYDLGFLLMDLIERELPDAANTVFNRYLAETRRLEDLDALPALPFYLSLRAAIRAKVTAARLAQAKADERATIADNAKKYFELACRLIAPPPPMLVAVGGLSGTGKSVLARALAPHIWPAPGAVWLRSDVERKILSGVGETDRLPPSAYTLEVKRQVYGTLTDKAARVLIAGHSALIDAVFAHPDERAALADMALRLGVKFHGLFLEADLETRIVRVGARRGDASDAGPDVARQQESYDRGTMDWTVVDASGTPAETLARAKIALKIG
ncbi:MAG: DNA-binding protein [Xanthobacteraceae bacterium]|nr:DNA-binding protein [Xanthobacteraceae bacterium]